MQTKYSLAAKAIKCVVRTCRHIKTGWCSPRRITHFWMAATWNRHAADDGASNLLLRSSDSMRMTFVLRCGASGDQCKCKHNGRNNGYDCFHYRPSFRSCSRPRFSATEASLRHCRAAIKSSPIRRAQCSSQRRHLAVSFSYWSRLRRLAMPGRASGRSARCLASPDPSGICEELPRQQTISVFIGCTAR